MHIGLPSTHVHVAIGDAVIHCGTPQTFIARLPGNEQFTELRNRLTRSAVSQSTFSYSSVSNPKDSKAQSALHFTPWQPVLPYTISESPGSTLQLI